jgi:hypothetical protein
VVSGAVEEGCSVAIPDGFMLLWLLLLNTPLAGLSISG